MPVQVINGIGIAGIRAGSSSQSGGNTPSFDTDAQAFITAASLTSSTQTNAVNDLVLDLKAAGLWTKMKALYPMVGGTSTKHLINLKTPGTYNLTFNGGWTHNASGSTPNGTTGYADTGLNLATNFTIYSAHYSIYFRPANGTSSFMGVTQGSPYIVEGWMLVNNGTNYGGFYNQDDACVKVTDTNPGGHYVSSVISSSLTFLTKKNIILGSTVAASSPANTTVYLGAVHQASTNTPLVFSNGQISFASLGDGLTYFESALFNQIVEKFQYALGRNVDTNRTFYFDRNYANESNVFIYNAGLTNSTQINATLNLVSDLKYTGIWSKLKAVYPMVGGTASAHKFNLVNATDADISNRMVFQGGWTHDSNGATPNGTNAYGDPKIASGSDLTANSTHVSFYSMTNVAQNSIDWGVGNGTARLILFTKWSDGNLYSDQYSETTNRIVAVNSNSTGFYISNRNSSTMFRVIKNGNIIGTNTNAATSIPSQQLVMSAYNVHGFPITYFSSRQCAFASVGSGLTDIESNLFYQIVEKFQSSLGRNINATQPFYYSSGYTNETNAFVFNGGITDATQISATNTLVNTLKTAGIWSKMKAVYPMVGGTATAHKFNLVNPVDSTSAYALTFNGGWTHTTSGATPNGTDGYANTNLIASNVFSTSLFPHQSYYSRTNSSKITDILMGAYNSVGSFGNFSLYGRRDFYSFTSDYPSTISYRDAQLSGSFDTTGFLIGSQNVTNVKLFKNNSLIASNTLARIANAIISTRSVYIGAQNKDGVAVNYTDKQCAFASIGDGLTDAEATTFYNAVQAFQTTLGRQV